MKKSMAALTIFLSLILVTNLFGQKVESGKFSGNYKSQGYSLNDGEGRRTFSVEVRFENSFESTPEIILSVTYLNAETKEGVRIKYELVKKAVSRDGFIIEISTWDDSKIHEIRGEWFALGQ
jgi:hypothetical protein